MRRRLLLVAPAVLAILLLASLTRHRYDWQTLPSRLRASRPPRAPADDATAPQAHIASWMRVSALLAAHAPTCSSPKRLEHAETVAYNPADDERPELLEMPAADVAHMRQRHQAFVAAIRAPAAPLLVFNAGTRGIVTTAGGRYMPVLTVSLRMLRRTGTALPVEVFLLSNDEYESHACEVVLPALNARCVVLEDVLRTAPPPAAPSKYALKSLALALSSFDDTLFLDADCFPLRDPQRLFDSEPYRSRGFVAWPDFWRSTTSRQYFEIADTPAVAPSVRASSEAGEMLVAKSTHGALLLLALYYNLFGKTHYYRLLSQGAMGEGDKETFLAAAVRLGLPFHAVAAPVRAIGWLEVEKDKLHGSAMVQYDPAEDYAVGRADATAGPASGADGREPVRPFFVHANFPKFDPGTIFASPVNPTRRTPSGTFQRCWTDRADTVESLGADVERHFWEEIRWTACEPEHRFRSWEGKHDICKNMTDYTSAVWGIG